VKEKMATKVRIVKQSQSFDLINVIAIIVLIGLVGLGGHLLGRFNQKEKTVTTEISGVQTLSYEGETGKNALELLQSKAKVETSDSSFGSFVMSINGTANTTDHFWMFYVNGQLASVGADQYQTKDGDKIEWRYEQL